MPTRRYYYGRYYTLLWRVVTTEMSRSGVIVNKDDPGQWLGDLFDDRSSLPDNVVLGDLVLEGLHNTATSNMKPCCPMPLKV